MKALFRKTSLMSLAPLPPLPPKMLVSLALVYDFLNEKSEDVSGLYREQGDAALQRAVVKAMKSGKGLVELLRTRLTTDRGVHAAARAVEQCLKAHEPIVLYANYSRFLKAAGDEDAIRDACADLPAAAARALHELCGHVRRVAGDDRLRAGQLAKVFAPLLLRRDEAADKAGFSYERVRVKVVEEMLALPWLGPRQRVAVERSRSQSPPPAAGAAPAARRRSGSPSPSIEDLSQRSLKVSWDADAAPRDEDELRAAFAEHGPIRKVGIGARSSGLLLFERAADAANARGNYVGPWTVEEVNVGANARAAAAAAAEPPQGRPAISAKEAEVQQRMVKVSWPAGEAAPSKAQLLDIFAPFGTLVNAGVNEGKHSALVLFSSVGAAQNAEAHFAAGVRRAPAAAGWTVQRQVPDGGDSAERPSTSTLALSNELALSPASTLALSPSSSTVLALSPSSGRSAASVARSGSLVARTLHVSWAAADRPARVRDVDAALGERGTILKCGFASRKNMALVQFATKEEAVAAQAHYVGRWRVRQYAALLYGQSADASSDAFDLSREPARDRALLLAWDPALTEASEDVDALVVALAVPVVALAQRQHTAVVLCRTAADARAAADEVETSYAALFRASWLGGAASLSAPVPQKIRDDAQPLEAPKPLDAARPAESQPPLVPPLDTARPTEAAPPVEAAPPSAVPDPAAALSQRRIEARLPTDTSCFLQPEPVDSRVHAVAANAGVGEVSLPSTQPAIPAAALHAPNAQSPRAPRASDGHQSRAPLAPAESWTVYQRPAARSAAPVPGLFAAPAGRWHDEAIPPAARSPPRPDDDSSLAAMTDTPHPEGQARPQSVRHDARAAGEPSADEDDWRGRALRAEQSVAERQSRAPGAAGGGTNEWRRRALQAESELGRPFDDGRPFSAADAALSAREMAHILQSHAQTLGGEIRATIKDVVIASAAATQSMGLAYEGGGAWRGDWGARGDYTAQGPPRVAPLPRPEADGYAADYAAASPVFSPPRARRRPGDVATPGRGDAFSQLLDEQARVARQLEGDLGRLRAELADIRGDDRRPGRAERAPAARAWQQPFTWHGDVTPYGKAPPGDFGFAPASMQPPYVRTQHMATTLSAHGHYKPSPDGFRPQDPALRQWWGTVQAPGAQYGAESSQGRYY